MLRKGDPGDPQPLCRLGFKVLWARGFWSTETILVNCWEPARTEAMLKTIVHARKWLRWRMEKKEDFVAMGPLCRLERKVYL